MAPKLQLQKRKTLADPGSSDELVDGLDGAFSQSEDEDEEVSSAGEQDEWELGSEEDESDEGEEEAEVDDERGLDAAEFSDGGLDDKEAMRKVLGSKDDQEPKIEVPFVDPKPQEVQTEETNYRIEKDANGGVKYVYNGKRKTSKRGSMPTARKLSRRIGTLTHELRQKLTLSMTPMTPTPRVR